MSTTDEIIDDLELGLWQLPMVLIMATVQISGAYQALSATIINSQVNFKCIHNNTIIIEETNGFEFDNECGANIFYNETDKDLTLPLHWETSCPYPVYDTSTFESTLTSEFNLICDESSKRAYFQMVFYLGGMIGSFYSGILGDRYGRKPVLLYAAILNFVLGPSLSFIPSYLLCLPIKFLSGITAYTIYTIAFCLVIEITPSKYRAFIGLLPGPFFGFGIIVFAAEGYFLRNWRYINIVANIPFIMPAILVFLADESPRWLIQNNKTEELRSVIKKAIKINKIKIDNPSVFTISKPQEENPSNGELGIDIKQKNIKIRQILDSEFLDLEEVQSPNSQDKKGTTEVAEENFCQGLQKIWNSPEIRKRLLTASSVFFLMGVFYYGIALNASNFNKSQVFLYTAILGLIEVPAVIIATVLVKYFSRKFIMEVNLIISGVLYLTQLIIPIQYAVVNWIFVMCAYLAITISYNVSFIFASEIFPTDIRARGTCCCVVMGSFGSLIAPIVTDILVTIQWWTVGLILGLCGLTAAFMVSLLPETKNTPLMDTIQEVENYTNKSRN